MAPVAETVSGAQSAKGRPRNRWFATSLALHGLVLLLFAIVTPKAVKEARPLPASVDVVIHRPQPRVAEPPPPPAPKPPIEKPRPPQRAPERPAPVPQAPRPAPEPAKVVPPPIEKASPAVARVAEPAPAVTPKPKAQPEPTRAFASDRTAPPPAAKKTTPRTGSFSASPARDVEEAKPRAVATTAVGSFGSREEATSRPTQTAPRTRSVTTAAFSETADEEPRTTTRAAGFVVLEGTFGERGITEERPRSRRSETVIAGGFGAAVEEPATAPPPRKRDTEKLDSPVEILSKPAPLYTEEARRLRVEGEVVLEVAFDAAGHLRVLRVVQGLGHGLDEAAIAAAKKIEFKPARRDGRPVDHTAQLRVVFRLA